MINFENKPTKQPDQTIIRSKHEVGILVTAGKHAEVPGLEGIVKQWQNSDKGKIKNKIELIAALKKIGITEDAEHLADDIQRDPSGVLTKISDAEKKFEDSALKTQQAQKNIESTREAIAKM